MKSERNMRDTPPDEGDLPKMASIEYGGKAVVALATDPNVMAKSRRFISIVDLSEEYGFTDVDGRRPKPL